MAQAEEEGGDNGRLPKPGCLEGMQHQAAEDRFLGKANQQRDHEKLGKQHQARYFQADNQGDDRRQQQGHKVPQVTQPIGPPKTDRLPPPHFGQQECGNNAQQQAGTAIEPLIRQMGEVRHGAKQKVDQDRHHF